MTSPSQAPHAIWNLNTPLNGLAWSQQEGPATCAVIGGNGTLYLVRADSTEPFPIILNEEAALLSLAATPHGFLTGNDAGQIHLTTAGGETHLLHSLPGKFIEHVAYSSHANQALVAAGKTFVTLALPTGNLVATHTAPSSIGGLAASPIGRRAAISHYGGATIFDLANAKNPPRTMGWKGSHLALTYSPDGKWLISSMQEQALHLWRLSDGMDLQMRGYPGKITQLAWASDQTTLATNGGTGVPLWSFANKERGPAGTQAKVLADSGESNLLVTAVAMHPKGPFAAIGYSDGLTLLTNTSTEQTILLHTPEVGNNTAVTGLAWAPGGTMLSQIHAAAPLVLTNFSNLIT